MSNKVHNNECPNCGGESQKAIPPGFALINKDWLFSVIDPALINAVEIEMMKDDPQGNQNLNNIAPDLAISGQAYETILNNIANEHINITKQAVDDAAKAGQDRYDFVTALEPHYDEILNSGTHDASGLIGDIYLAGKAEGFKESDINKFFSPADFQAISFTREYNFGLIKNMTDDLRRSIGDEVFAAKLRGDDMPTLAKAIADLGINPIQAGGRMLSVPERSMLIARTETARASMQGNVIALQQQGVTSFDWMDSGNENECGDCEDNAAGSPYAAEDLPDYPAHPDCCCNIAPSSVMGEQAQTGDVGSDNGPTDPDSIANLVTGIPTPVTGDAMESAGLSPADYSDDAIASNTPAENKELMDKAETAFKEPTKPTEPISAPAKIVENIPDLKVPYETEDAYEWADNHLISDHLKEVMANADMDIEMNDPITALDEYTSSEYREINWLLRDPTGYADASGNTAIDVEHYNYSIQAIDQLMSDSKTESDVSVYRVYSDNFVKSNYLKVGSEFNDAGFVSTSLSEDGYETALKGLEYDPDTVYKAEIVVPKGTEAIPVDYIESPDEFREIDNGEAELVLSRGGTYQVVGIDNDAHTIQVVRLPDIPSPKVETEVIPAPVGESVGTNIPKMTAIDGSSEGSLNNPIFYSDQYGREWVAKSVSPDEGAYEWAGKAISDALDVGTPKEMDLVDLDTFKETNPKIVEEMEKIVKKNQFVEGLESNVLITSKIPDTQTFVEKFGFLRPGLKSEEENIPLTASMKEDMAKMYFKDVLIGNQDGHLGNYLVDDSGKLFNIDDSMSGGEKDVRSEFGMEIITQAVRDGELDPALPSEEIEEWLDKNYHDTLVSIRLMDFEEMGIDPIARDEIESRQDRFDEVLVDDIERRLVAAKRVVTAEEE
jgi:hypothetical protein